VGEIGDEFPVLIGRTTLARLVLSIVGHLLKYRDDEAESAAGGSSSSGPPSYERRGAGILASNPNELFGALTGLIGS
jgi:hypothetical protein